MGKYQIVLFKNKKKLKILKSYESEDNALKFYEEQVKSNQDVNFDVQFVNGKPCMYEIGILVKNNIDKFFFKKDEYGRQIKMELLINDYVLTKIDNLKKEELIYDLQKKKRIQFKTLIYEYLKKDGLKIVSLINNKLIIQKENEFFFFSLKNELDSKRLIDCLSEYFIKNGRSDSIFVYDSSKLQKRYIYQMLKNNNIDLNSFYRRFTTYNRN